MSKLDLHPDDADHRTGVICQLVAARTGRSLLQRDIAGRMDITASGVSAFERGRNQTLAGIQKYARACDLRVEIHFDGLPDVGCYEADVLLVLVDQALAAGNHRRADGLYRAAVLARYGAIRQHLGVSCRQIGRQVGCSGSSVSQVERDRDDVRLSTLQRLVRALGGRLRLNLAASRPADAAPAPPVAA